MFCFKQAMFKVISGLFLFLLFSWCLADNVSPWTLDQLHRAAQNSNPRIQLAVEVLTGLGYSEESEQRLDWPTLSANTGINDHGGRSNRSTDASLDVSLKLPIFHGGEFTALRNIAVLQRKKAEQELLRERQKLYRDVDHAYTDFVLARELMQEDQLVVERLQEHARITQVFYREAQVWRNDVLQAEVRVAQGSKQLVSAQTNMNKFQATLNDLIGQSIDAPLTVEGVLVWKQTPLLQTVNFDHATRSHPDVIISDLEQQVSGEEITAAKAVTRPQVDFSVTQEFSRDLQADNSVKNDLSVGLTASMKLWDGGRSTKAVAAAKSGYQQAAISSHLVNRNLKLKINNALLDLKQANEQVEILNEALDKAQQNYRVNKVRYQEREGTASDLLDAQDLYSSTRKDYLTALAAYQKAIANVHYELAEQKTFP